MTRPYIYRKELHYPFVELRQTKYRIKKMVFLRPEFLWNETGYGLLQEVTHLTTDIPFVAG